jgi:hypothetical protein
MKEDIPLPVDLPAVALKKGLCRVAWPRGETDHFQAMGITVWAIGNGRIPPEAAIAGRLVCITPKQARPAAPAEPVRRTSRRTTALPACIRIT